MIFTVPNSLGSVRESNDCHTPGGSAAGGQFCSKGGVPPQAGTLPLTPGHIRAYHYTEALDAVLTEGLSVSHSRGETYGEPNALWFSTAKPGDFKSFVEVHLRPEEIGLGAMWSAREVPTQQRIDDFNAAGGNFTVRLRDIPPSRFATYHRPWHTKYYYLMEEYPPTDLSTPRWQRKLSTMGYTSVEQIVQSFEKIGGDEYGPAVEAWAKLVRKAAKR